LLILSKQSRSWNRGLIDLHCFLFPKPSQACVTFRSESDTWFMAYSIVADF
jgi:hypothetical protein